MFDKHKNLNLTGHSKEQHIIIIIITIITPQRKTINIRVLPRTVVVST